MSIPSDSATTVSDNRLWLLGGATAATCLMLVEGTFAVLFYKVLVPRLQQLRPPAEYRGYARDRRRLLNRILQRFEATCHATNTPVLPFIQSYVRQWFHPVHPVPRQRRSIAFESQVGNPLDGSRPFNNSTTNDGDKGGRGEEKKDNDEEGDKRASMQHTRNPQEEEMSPEVQFWPKKQDMDEFLSWAFFGTDCRDMEEWMIDEMNMMYETLEKRYGVTFEPGQCTEPYRIQPMRVTLDPLEPRYRPFLVYGIFATLKSCANIILRMSGFQYYTTSTGLKYWFRSGRRRRPQQLKQQQQQQQLVSKTATQHISSDHDKRQLPLLFLHGIAPGGFALYLPMLFHLGNDGRPLFFFENPGISFGLRFWSLPPSEHETTTGVWEAVHKHLCDGKDSKTDDGNGKKANIGVAVLGHSFGSCSITWLIHSQFAHYIKQVVLVDPVSILLHEPDVVTNFLYKRKMEELKQHETDPVLSSNNVGGPNSSIIGSEQFKTGQRFARKKQSNIRVVANEIFTEYYLRRHFAWYNSELWLDDIPPDVKVLVCLSERDQIVATDKVRQELYRVKSMGDGSTSSNTEGGTKRQFLSQESADSWFSASSSLSDMDGSICDDVDDELDGSNIEVLTWKGADHAHCVTRPHTWRQIQFAMKLQEQRIHAEQQLQSQSSPSPVRSGTFAENKKER